MKLNEAVTSKVLDQKAMKSFYKNLESQEKEYAKKDLMFKYIIATEVTSVDTVINGKKETSNKANIGDYILTGTKGEKYILTPDKFKSRYEIIDNITAKTKPVKIKAKQYSGEAMSFMASWGEEMILTNGDFLVNNNDEYYRIEKSAFGNTYK